MDFDNIICDYELSSQFSAQYGQKYLQTYDFNGNYEWHYITKDGFLKVRECQGWSWGGCVGEFDSGLKCKSKSCKIQDLDFTGWANCSYYFNYEFKFGRNRKIIGRLINDNDVDKFNINYDFDLEFYRGQLKGVIDNSTVEHNQSAIFNKEKLSKTSDELRTIIYKIYQSYKEFELYELEDYYHELDRDNFNKLHKEVRDGRIYSDNLCKIFRKKAF